MDDLRLIEKNILTFSDQTSAELLLCGDPKNSVVNICLLSNALIKFKL